MKISNFNTIVKSYQLEEMKEYFGSKTINSYLKLKSSEIKNFNQKEKFDKTKSITKWERVNTLDC